MKNSRQCPLCRYQYPENESGKRIMQNTFKILDNQLITDYLDGNVKEIFEMFTPFFAIPDFHLMD